ncbi:MAG: CRISPR-associated protein Csd1 family, partial [Pelosinus sp.]|nr:CRISPR-associated protein Csd1 family [Pelosinus sp.]
MILQALNDHYQRLLEEEDSEIAPPGYSSAKVSYALILNLAGDIVDILTLAKVEGKKNIPKVLLVPEQAIRTSGVSANILCDNCSYIIGIERSKDGEIKVSQEKYADFKKKNECFLSGIKSGDVVAVKAFLEKWNPENALSHPIILPRIEELLSSSNLVFKVDGSTGYIHEQSNVREA